MSYPSLHDSLMVWSGPPAIARGECGLIVEIRLR